MIGAGSIAFFASPATAAIPQHFHFEFPKGWVDTTTCTASDAAFCAAFS